MESKFHFIKLWLLIYYRKLGFCLFVYPLKLLNILIRERERDSSVLGINDSYHLEVNQPAILDFPIYM